MSLFIGNLSSSVNVSDLEKLFGEYGKCTIKYLGTYGFAEFDEEKAAEAAFFIGNSKARLENLK